MEIRTAKLQDLQEINEVIEAAIMTWQLPDRVKRLALPTYRYNEIDLQHFAIVVAIEHRRIQGVAAWDTEAHPGPAGDNDLLLHGIYVLPQQQHRGIGSQLFKAAEQAARERGLNGILVKVQKDAEGFFVSRGLQRLAAQDPNLDYANRYRKPLD